MFFLDIQLFSFAIISPFPRELNFVCSHISKKKNNFCFIFVFLFLTDYFRFKVPAATAAVIIIDYLNFHIDWNFNLIL